NIFKRSNGVSGIAIISRDNNNLIINLAVILKLHHPNDPRLEEDARREWLVSNNKSIQLIAIFVKCLRNKTVVGWFSKNCRFDTIQLNNREVAFPFYLVT